MSPGPASGIRRLAAPMSLAASRRPPGLSLSSRRPRSTRFLVVAWTTAKVRRGPTRLTSVLRACTVTGPSAGSAASTAPSTGRSRGRSAYWASISSSAGPDCAGSACAGSACAGSACAGPGRGRVYRSRVAGWRTGIGRGSRGAAPFRLGLEPRPAREAVVPGDGELSGRQRDLAGDLAEPPQCAGVAADGGTVQFAGLTAKLIGVWAVGKLGHDASPHRVRGPRSGSPEDGRGCRQRSTCDERRRTRSFPRTRRRPPAPPPTYRKRGPVGVAAVTLT